MRPRLICVFCLSAFFLVACTITVGRYTIGWEDSLWVSDAEVPTDIRLVPPTFDPGELSYNTNSAGIIQTIHVPNARVDYYLIRSSEPQEMRYEIDMNGPVSSSGGRVASYTRWNIFWTWPGIGSSECQLADATVTYSITVIFPQWISVGSVDPHLIAKWNTYIEALAAHEKKHVDIILGHVPDVLNEIQISTCNSAVEAATHVLEIITLENQRYDNTVHALDDRRSVFP